MRILFVMQSPEYLRFYDSTIRELAHRGHTVILAINGQNDAKPVRLEDVGEGDAHVESRGFVPRREDVWRPVGRRLRGVVDFGRYLHPRFARARALRVRMKYKVLPRGLRWLDWIPMLPDPVVRRGLALLNAFERSIPNSPVIDQFIRDTAPDVVLVSPLIDAASDQVELVKSARAIGIPVGVCVASWDNLTNKGLLRVTTDAVIVWNDAQKAEAVAWHGVAPEKVHTTGAQVFDLWFERRPTTTREEFCARVGLPADKPFILYTCSSSFIALSPAEVTFVRRWLERIRQEPSLRGVPVLIRPHPYNATAWETADFSDHGGVAIWPGRAYNPMDEENRNGYFDSLYHSAAVVGINTSAMIEAAILGKPVLSMMSTGFGGTQEGTIHFHHLLPENGGFLRLSGSIDEHAPQLADVMRHPEAARAETDRFVRTFVRPHGIDRPSTPLLADTIERIAALPAPVPDPVPAWAPLARAFMVVTGTWVWICNSIFDPDHRAKTRRLIATERKKREMAKHRAIKEAAARKAKEAQRREKEAAKRAKLDAHRKERARAK